MADTTAGITVGITAGGAVMAGITAGGAGMAGIAAGIIEGGAMAGMAAAGTAAGDMAAPAAGFMAPMAGIGSGVAGEWSPDCRWAMAACLSTPNASGEMWGRPIAKSGVRFFIP